MNSTTGSGLYTGATMTDGSEERVGADAHTDGRGVEASAWISREAVEAVLVGVDGWHGLHHDKQSKRKKSSLNHFEETTQVRGENTNSPYSKSNSATKPR